MYVCEECGTEDTVRMVYTDNDAFPLCGECAKELSLPNCEWKI